MKYAVLGTGMVGTAHAERLVELGHEVFMGTRDVEKTSAQTKPAHDGLPSFSEWHKKNSKVKLVNFSKAASEGEVIIEALNGANAISILSELKDELDGKVLIDISNPLDFSKGMPPSLFVSNTNSLGEEIQKALPKTMVVKSLNTVTSIYQVRPNSLSNGEHTVFVGGNNENAKQKTITLLKEYGWKDIVDLGDITAARATEMYLPLWLRVFGVTKTPFFSIKLIK